MSKDLPYNAYSILKQEIGKLLQYGREQAGRAVSTILLQTYWQIGQHIVEFEQKGEAKPEYGSELIDRLSRDLTLEFGKGFSRSNLFMIRKLYLTFSKIQTPSRQFEKTLKVRHNRYEFQSYTVPWFQSYDLYGFIMPKA